METQTIDGLKVTMSRKEGTPLVILTRLASAGSGIWGGIWEALAQHYTVASVGHAKPSQDGAVQLGTYADDLVTLADALGEERFHLVGWNGGAQIGLQATERHCDRLASLTLITPFRDWGERRQIDLGIDFLRLFLKSGRRDLYTWHWFMAGFSDDFIQANFDRVETLVEQRLANDPFVKMDVDRAMHWMQELRKDHVSDDHLAGLSLPTLVLAAGRNRWHAGPTLTMAQRIAGLIPSAELEVRNDMGSLFPIEDPDFVSDKLLDFLGRNALISNR